MTRSVQNPTPYDERALLLLVTDLEDRIEQLEGARARLGAQQTDPRLRETLRRLRRQRASCLSRLLS